MTLHASGPAHGSPETEMSMEDILASIKKIVVQDSEIVDPEANSAFRAPSSPTAARWSPDADPEGEASRPGILRLTQWVQDDGTTIDVSRLSPEEWNVLQREISRTSSKVSPDRARETVAKEGDREPRLRADGAASAGATRPLAPQEAGRAGASRPDARMTDPRWLARRSEFARTEDKEEGRATDDSVDDRARDDRSPAHRQAPSRAATQAAPAPSTHTARDSARGFGGLEAGHRFGMASSSEASPAVQASPAAPSSLDALLYDILNQKIDEWMQSHFGGEVREILHTWMEARLPALVEALLAEKLAEQAAQALRRR